MASGKKLNKTARRQLRDLGQASGAAYVADRMAILNAAVGWLDENDFEDPDTMDVLAVAEFLAGDRTEST